MSNWAHFMVELNKELLNKGDGRAYLLNNLTSRLRAIAKIRKSDNIFLYGSAFLQKPNIHQWTSLVREDINGIMNSLYSMNNNKLIIVLHTPGGEGAAADAIVEYLQNKFEYIEVIVPYMAMSAGTMISLSGDCVIMGKQSQLGPIDPQFPLDGAPVAANNVIKTFNRAKKEIAADPNLSLLWQPILSQIKPGFIDECEEESKLGEETLKKSLIERNLIAMDRNDPKKEKMASKLAKYLNGNYEDGNVKNKQIRAHSQRIGIDDLKALGFTNNLNIESLEANQKLQDEVMSAYHLMTILFERTPTTKIIHSPNTGGWSKEYHNPN